jgi:hypothetical protein
MTLAEAIDLARELIGTRESVGTWDLTTLTRLLNVAQRYWWMKIANAAQGLCMEEKQLTYTAGSLSQSLATAGKGSVLKLLAVFRLPNAGAISATNHPQPITPAAGMADLETDSDSDSSIGRAEAEWTYHRDNSDNLHLRFAGGPVQDTTYLLARLIRQPTDLVLTTDKLFGDTLHHLHNLVVYRACELACVKVREAANYFGGLQREEWAEAEETLKNSDQMPMGIRHVADWE